MGFGKPCPILAMCSPLPTARFGLSTKDASSGIMLAC